MYNVHVCFLQEAPPPPNIAREGGKEGKMKGVGGN